MIVSSDFGEGIKKALAWGIFAEKLTKKAFYKHFKSSI